MSSYKDLTDKTFTRLTFIEQVEPGKGGRKRALWECSCGDSIVASVYDVKSGNTKSCGCLQRETIGALNKTHGLSNGNSHEYTLLMQAKTRAKRQGVPFEIEVSDIIIPSHCPILGIPLYRGTEVSCSNSPTVDKRVPERGYTKENILVISMKANRIKNNSTPEELRKVAEFMAA